MNYHEFQRAVRLSKQDICRETFAENRESIRVKKEKTVVRNLEKIFDATLRISNQKGFQAMSMRDLSRETGLSMGALYSYFSSKEELLEIIQRHGRIVTQRVLEARVLAEKGALARLRTAVRTHLYLSETMQPWFYFSYMETKNLTPQEREKAVFSEIYTEGIFENILKQGQTEGVFCFTDSRLSASVIKAVLQDWYLKRWKYAKRRVSVDQYARFVLGLLEAFLLKSGRGSMQPEK
jgi:AcrR family transcriptional regulator